MGHGHSVVKLISWNLKGTTGKRKLRYSEPQLSNLNQGAGITEVATRLGEHFTGLLIVPLTPFGVPTGLDT